MKKILFYAFAMLLAVACYDDTALWDELKDHESRIVELETLCNKMNTNISSLQSIVTALQDKDYVTNVAPVKENGKEIGYVITFSKSGSITIYHGADGKDGANGQNGKDGADGKDGYTPVLGVKMDTDGAYYWTLDGEWLTDASGNKIPTTGKDGADGEDGTDGANGEDGKDGQDGADGKDGQDGADGITPQLKIEGSYWYISYDNGQTWERLGKAVGEDGKDGADGADGEDGDSFFKSVTQDEENVYITLADGTEFVLPKAKQTNVTLELNKVYDDFVVFVGEVTEKPVDLKVSVYYSEDEDLTIYNHKDKISLTDFSDNIFSLVIEGLTKGKEYYYFAEVIFNGTITYGSVRSFTTKERVNYVDEYGVDNGGGFRIGNTIWAPVNCGYHEADFKYGKLYQWGRKYGQGYDGPITSKKEDDTYSDAILPILKPGGVSASEANDIGNANVFYTGYTNHDLYSNMSDWSSDLDDNLWNSGTEYLPVKTNNDPCPAGWRVPTYLELSELYANFSSSKKDTEGHISYYFKTSDASEQVQFLASGYLYSQSPGLIQDYENYTLLAVNRGRRGFYWSSKATPSKYDQSSALSLNKGASTGKTLIEFPYEAPRNRGYSVRCVQE